MFKKNKIYQFNGTKQVCLLVDNTYACLAPISANKKNDGYRIKMNKCGLYPTDLSMMPNKVTEVGRISNGLYIKK